MILSITYEYSKFDIVKCEWTNRIPLCFICATRIAMSTNPLTEKITMQSRSQWHKCSSCGCEITDRIEIEEQQ